MVALLYRDEADTTTECRDYNFDMTALADHLRRQIDQNRNAAYFNIDILKYQVWIRKFIEFHSMLCKHFTTFLATLHSKSGSVGSPLVVLVVGDYIVLTVLTYKSTALL